MRNLETGGVGVTTLSAPRKVLAVFLSIVLAFGLSPFAKVNRAHAEEVKVGEIATQDAGDGDGGEDTPEASSNVAQIDTTDYSTLAEAVSAVSENAETETTIKLLSNVTLDGVLEFPSSKNIKLDLNGYTVKRESGNAVLYVNGGKLAITDSSTSGNGAVELATEIPEGEKSYLYKSVLVSKGDFTLSKGTLRGTGVGVFGLSEGSKISVTGGSIVGTSYAGIFAWTSDVSVQGGSVVGNFRGVDSYAGGSVEVSGGSISTTAETSTARGIFVENGTSKVTVSGGEIAAKYYGIEVDSNAAANVEITGGSITTMNSSTIYVISKSDAGSKVTIKGGTIKSAHKYNDFCCLYDGTGSETSVFDITGGTFSDGYISKFLTTTYKTKENGDGLYDVVLNAEPVEGLHDSAVQAANAYMSTHYEKETANSTFNAGDDFYVKAIEGGAITSDLASITIGDKTYNSTDAFELSVGNNAFAKGNYFKAENGALSIAFPVVLFDMLGESTVKVGDYAQEFTFTADEGDTAAVTDVRSEDATDSPIKVEKQEDGSYTLTHDKDVAATKWVEFLVESLKSDTLMITKKVLTGSDGNAVETTYGVTTPNTSSWEGNPAVLGFYAFGYNNSDTFSKRVGSTYDYQAYLVGIGKTASLKLNLKSSTRHNVTFDTNGGSTVEAQKVWNGDKAEKPASDPAKDGYTFAGWQLQDADYDFTEAVNSAITLKAKWAKNVAAITRGEQKTYYATLKDAVDAASDGETVSLTSGFTEGALTINKNVTLDLNGQTFTETGQLQVTAGKVTIKDSSEGAAGKLVLTTTEGVAAFQVKNAGTELVLESGTVESAVNTVLRAGESGKIIVKGGSVVGTSATAVAAYAENLGELVVEGGKVSGVSSALTASFGGTVSVSGGEVESQNAYGVAAYQYYGSSNTAANVTISGGKVSGKTGARPYYGATVKVTGGEIAGTENGVYVGGVSASGAGHAGTVSIEGGTVKGTGENAHGVFVYGGIATISGGSISGKLGTEASPVHGATAVISATGGKFSAEPENAYVSEGYGVFNNEGTDSATYPKKVAEAVTVTFDSDEGTAVEAQTIEKGKTATKPADPTKEGYSFINWFADDSEAVYDFSTPVNASLTLKARWKAVAKANEGLHDVAVAAAETFMSEEYNKHGDGDKFNASDKLYVLAVSGKALPTELATIKVNGTKYKANDTFSMSAGMNASAIFNYFKVIDGSLYLAFPIALFEMTDASTIVADDQEFSFAANDTGKAEVTDVYSEKAENSLFLSIDKVESDEAWTLRHTALKNATEWVAFAIKDLAPNAKLITKKAYTYTNGEQKTTYGFTDSEPGRNGASVLAFYPFPWNGEPTASDGVKIDYQAYLVGTGKTATMNLTLSVPAAKTVTFDANNGTEKSEVKVDDGTAVAAPTDNLEKEGYDFKGWFAEDATDAYNFETPVTSDIMLTAQWEAKTYDVKVAEGITGGTVTTDPADKATYESDVTVTATPDESHYVGKVTYQVGDAEAVEVAKGENGAYSFKMPAGNVTVSAEFTDKAPQNITVPETFDVFVNESGNLGATVDSDEKLTYESSDTEVAAVDESGKVSGVKAGTATITVKAAGTEKLLADEKAVTVTVRDVVAKIGDKSYATLADAVKAANDSETVELVADSIETEALAFPAGKAVTVDLKGKKLTLPALAVQVKDGANATIESTGDTKGEIYTGTFATGSKSLFNVLTNSSVSLENIKLVTNGTALFPQGDAAKVSVKNCDINAGVYAVGTNSATTDNYNVVIDLQDSTLSATGFNGADGDDAPLMINVAGTMNVKNCTVSGHRIGVLARAGKVTIADSKIVYSGSGNEVANFDDSQAWGYGNNVYGAAITVGNYGTATATAYKSDADVTLENVTVENTSMRSALAVFDNPGFKATVKVEGDATKVQGAILNKTTANSASSVEVAGGLFSDDSVKSVLAKGYGAYTNDDDTYKLKVDAAAAIIDGTYYKTLQEAANTAAGEKQVALVGDVAEGDAIALTTDLTKAIVSYGDFDKAKLNVTVPEGYELKTTDDADAKTVTYELKYKVSVAEDIVNGKIGPVPEFAVKGEKVKITVEPELGYELDKLTYNDGTNTVDIENGEFEMPAAIVTVTATFKALPGLGDAVVAPLVDHADGKETPLTETGLKIDSQTYDSDSRVATVKLSSTALPKHVNSAGTAGYWVGIGIPVGTADALDGYTVATGYGTYNAETADFTSSRDSWDGVNSTFYFGTGKDGEYLDNPAAYRTKGAYVALKDTNGLDSIYQLDLTGLKFQSDIEYATAKGGNVTGAEHAVDGDTVSLAVEPESERWQLDTLTITDVKGDPVERSENYEFTMPASKATVTPVFTAALSDSDITLKQSSVAWAADTTFAPEIDTVKVGDYTLVAGEDYEVTDTKSGTSAGEYTITITGKGIYTGTATAKLTVTPAEGWVKIEAKPGIIEAKVSGESQEIELDDAYVVQASDAGSRTYTKVGKSALDVNATTGAIIVPAGTVPTIHKITVEVSKDATDNYSAAKATMETAVQVKVSWDPATFTKENVKVTLVEDSVVYDGKPHSAQINNVTLFGISIFNSGDCIVATPGSRIDAGTDYVTVTSDGALKGESGAVTLEYPFTVEKKDISDTDAVEVDPFNDGKNYKYTGAVIEPTANVKYKAEGVPNSKQQLVQDEDYTLAYVNNTNVASANDGDKAPTAYFTGVGNFKGSRAVKFTITGADIAEDCTIAHIDAQKRTGARITPDLTITNNESGVVLVPGVDYIAGYANNIAATTADKPANVTITGLGSYAGSVAYASFVITDDLKDLADCSIETIYPVKYEGKPVVPPVVVKDASGNALTLGTDYTVDYANNDKRGTATVTVTGAGNYAGTLTTTFEIYGLSDMTFDERAKIDIDPVFYTGEKAVPNVKVTLADGTVLQPGEFEVEVDGDAIEPNGEDESYSATVKPVEEAGVKGNSRQVSFEIKPANLNTCTVTGINDVKYTGAEIPLNPIVTNAIGKELNPETDYLVVPASDDDDFKSVGAHRALIAGTGEHYTGATVVTFNIEATNFVDAGVEPVIDGDTSWTGSAVTPVVVKAGEVTLKSGVDYTVRYIGDNKNIGSVKYTVIGYGAFEGSVLSGTFEITRAPIAEPTAVSGLVYSGKEQTGVKAGSGYKVIGNTATNAGSYEATVTPDEHHAWKDGTYAAKTIPWSIAKAPQTITLGKNAKTGKYAYNKTIAMGAKSNTGNKVVYSTSDPKVATVTAAGSVKVVKGSGTAEITAKVAGNDNYEEATASITVTAVKAANPLKLQAATASGKNTKAQSFDLTKNAKTKGGIIKTAGGGTVTYTKVKVTDNKNKPVSKALGNKFTVKSGKLTVAKGTKKGTYKVTVKAVAAGNGNYNKSATNLTAVVTVKVS